MKANQLLKHNIDALLSARHQTRHDLAVWVRRTIDKSKTDPWISGIFTRPDREFQMKYLDRIADFFGIATYQLFQPGISPLTERRGGRDRRTGRDRRVSMAAHGATRHTPDIETVTPWERTFLVRVRGLTAEERRQVENLVDLVVGRKETGPSTGGSAARAASSHAPDVQAQRTQKRRRA